MNENTRHVLIVNPVAGKENCVIEMAVLEMRLEEMGFKTSLRVSSKAGDSEKIAKEVTDEAKDYDFTFIYACGGDGTLNEVVNGIMQSECKDRVAVTHIPRGTGNDFIKSFVFPEAFKPENFVSDDISIKPIDLMKVNGRYCVNICSAGLDARIGTGIQKYRKYGKNAYFMSLMANMVGKLGRRFYVEINGRPCVDDDLTMVCVCNGGWYGGGFNPVPQASITDGWLDVLVVSDVGMLMATSLLSAYKRGKFQNYPELIKYHRAQSIKIVPYQVDPVNVDGETLNSGCIDIKMMHNAIAFFAPSFTW